MTSRKFRPESAEWPFDQAPNVAAITTRQVIDMNCPILQVAHYVDDHSLAFLCGTTEETDDYRAIHMGDALKLDESLLAIADLPPGWSAYRQSKDAPWELYPEES